MRLMTAVLSSCGSERDSNSSLFLILCSVPLIIVILMCAILRNFDFLERIIGLNLENNWKTFQEVQNRIIGKILSIIASSLFTYMCENVNGQSISLNETAVCDQDGNWEPNPANICGKIYRYIQYHFLIINRLCLNIYHIIHNKLLWMILLFTDRNTTVLTDKDLGQSTMFNAGSIAWSWYRSSD